MVEFKNVGMYFDKCKRVTAYLNDFSGNVEDLKSAFYTIWRYQMTFSLAYEIYLLDTRGNGVELTIYCKDAFIDNLLDTMNDLGYRNIQVHGENIGFIETSDLPEDQLIDLAIVDY